MPCGYAYAITIRKAQSSTLDTAALWFDQTYPPGITDWRPVAKKQLWGRQVWPALHAKLGDCLRTARNSRNTTAWYAFSEDHSRIFLVSRTVS